LTHPSSHLPTSTHARAHTTDAHTRTNVLDWLCTYCKYASPVTTCSGRAQVVLGVVRYSLQDLLRNLNGISTCDAHDPLFHWQCDCHRGHWRGYSSTRCRDLCVVATVPRLSRAFQAVRWFAKHAHRVRSQRQSVTLCAGHWRVHSSNTSIVLVSVALHVFTVQATTPSSAPVGSRCIVLVVVLTLRRFLYWQPVDCLGALLVLGAPGAYHPVVLEPVGDHARPPCL